MFDFSLAANLLADQGEDHEHSSNGLYSKSRTMHEQEGRQASTQRPSISSRSSLELSRGSSACVADFGSGLVDIKQFALLQEPAAVLVARCSPTGSIFNLIFSGSKSKKPKYMTFADRT